jgi:hypothetical protein
MYVSQPGRIRGSATIVVLALPLGFEESAQVDGQVTQYFRSDLNEASKKQMSTDSVTCSGLQAPI